MATGKRVADAAPGIPPKHIDKKQKTAAVPTASAVAKTPKRKTQTAQTAQTAQTTQTTRQTVPIPIRPETSRHGPFTVVPATPGTIVNLAKKDKTKTAKDRKEKDSKDSKEKPQPPPNTLPMEPHAAILAELQPKYAVRTLSVISSTRMEKRIKAVLDHLASGSPAGTTTTTTTGMPAKPLPGVVLLHARAPDANKLVSIAEIVKRRIREGVFAESTAADALERKGNPKKSKGRAAAVMWYQYDRIYDVKSARTAEGSSVDDDDDDDEDDDDDAGLHRLDAALSDNSASTKTTTYMSIMLSRIPISELHKNPEITVQCSTDPLEVEYEQFMAAA